MTRLKLGALITVGLSVAIAGYWANHSTPRALALSHSRALDQDAANANAATLVRAAYTGDLATVTRCIRQGVPLNARLGSRDKFLGADGQGIPVGAENWTALHAAASAGNSGIVKLLIDRGADLDIDDGFGATALYMALDFREKSVGRQACASQLIEAGAAVNTHTGGYIDGFGGSTPLHEAVSCDYVEVVRKLLEAGAHVNAKDGAGATPLHYASFHGACPEIIDALNRFGADPTCKDGAGFSPADWKRFATDIAE